MKKRILFGAVLATAGLAHAAFITTNATDGAQLRGGSATNVVQGADSLGVKDAGDDGMIDNGGLRIGMLKLDLSGITGTVYAASINLFQKEPDPYDFYVWTVSHDASGQNWTEATATLDSVLTSGLFTPAAGLWDAGDASLNLIGVKAFLGDDGASQYNWESYSSFKNKDLTTYINDAVADGSNTLTLVFASSSASSIGTFRGASHGTVENRPYLQYSYDVADQIPASTVHQVGGDALHRNGGWNQGIPDGTVNSITYDIVDPDDTNLVISITATAGNPADVLNYGTTLIGVDSSARQADSSTGRLTDDETLTITVSYEDPNGSLLDLSMSGIGTTWNTGSSEITAVVDAFGTTNLIGSFANETFVQGTYGNTGLEDLSTSNTGTWQLVWSAANVDTSSGVGAFAIQYLTTAGLAPSHGVVDLGSVWDSSADIGLSGQSASGVSVTVTNLVGDSNRRLFQRVSSGDFASVPVQVTETIKVSFTAIIGSDLPLNGDDRIFRGSFWDEGDTSNNGLSFRVDYGAVGGETMELGKGNVQSAGYVGSVGGSVTTNVAPSNALVNQGDSADFVLKLTRDTASTVTLSLTQGDITLTESYTDFNFDSFDAIGFRMNSDQDNHVIISNLVVEVSQPGDGPDPDSYAYWAENSGLTAGVNDAWDDDAEAGGGDGVNNLLEYALGGDPLVDDAAAILPSENVAGGYLNYAYLRRTDAAARGLTYEVGSATDLVYDALTNATEEVVGAASGGFEPVTNRVSTATEYVQFMGLTVELSE
ncbi:hypothetical protein PDESU_04018 [Pontiella desulfatans]|uniref:Uncharacterized protein n=1 Tax=Pontiella desulfatans TaxID=2750659 RepID=A0A6C2U685_PONDE|nr:hypothetical protein [Pontiella desulfatans]VGO15435.1 hypothetical protein PDESU_04018 [Pontiella desulfatans]